MAFTKGRSKEEIIFLLCLSSFNVHPSISIDLGGIKETTFSQNLSMTNSLSLSEFSIIVSCVCRYIHIKIGKKKRDRMCMEKERRHDHFLLSQPHYLDE